MDIGQRIVKLREAQELNTNNLAKMSKVAQSHLRGIELGSKQPGIDVLERICESLGLTLADFFNVENQDNQAGMHRLVNAAEKLNPEQLEQLIKFIEVMTIVKRT